MKETVSKSNLIPKIIHYCWYGGKPKPPILQDCIDTWSHLEGYQIIEWNETNCSFNENDFIKKSYSEKKWAFVADYYRLKALYDYGGIYLDTDVKVFRTFDNLLHHPMFLNFIFDCSIGTAVIGCMPKHPLIKALLTMYEHTVFGQTSNGKQLEQLGDTYVINHYVANNYYFTYYILKNYPDFVLNNTYQDLKDFVVYPKELFEIGSLTQKHYTIHYNTGTWHLTAKKDFKSKIKSFIAKSPAIHNFIQICVRKIRYQKLNKKIPFYEYSLAQKKNLPLPPL